MHIPFQIVNKLVLNIGDTKEIRSTQQIEQLFKTDLFVMSVSRINTQYNPVLPAILQKIPLDAN